MENEKIMVTKSTLPKYEKYCEMIKKIWETHWLTNNGPLHEKLQEALKVYCDTLNATLFTNGHLALENAIASLHLKEGGEVITTPFTFVSTTHAITRNGLKPVFCDINPIDYTIDVNKIEELINENTVAILPVHVYGNICDVEKIQEIANKYNLKVIYDAAHAFGERKNGINVANFGDISMFSFHATKVFNTIEGGCLTYSNNDLNTVLNRQKNFGIRDEENIDYIGGNAKMNEFQAAMGLCNLEELEGNINRRKELYLYYLELLSNIKGIKTNILYENIDYNYSYFPIIIQEQYGLSREELVALLNAENIFPRKYFYPLTNEIECYSSIDCGDTPIAHDISQRVLTLPIYPDLEKEKVEKICKIIEKNRR